METESLLISPGEVHSGKGVSGTSSTMKVLPLGFLRFTRESCMLRNHVPMFPHGTGVPRTSQINALLHKLNVFTFTTQTEAVKCFLCRSTPRNLSIIFPPFSPREKKVPGTLSFIRCIHSTTRGPKASVKPTRHILSVQMQQGTETNPVEWSRSATVQVPFICCTFPFESPGCRARVAIKSPAVYYIR